MKIPMRVDYGVRALVELALHYGDGPVQTAEIAAKQGIPVAYLDQLMASLNKFGFRGQPTRAAGWSLAGSSSPRHQPEHGDVEARRQQLPPRLPDYPDDCVLSDSCAQQEVWKSVEDAILHLLSNITLADLAERQLSLAATVS